MSPEQAIEYLHGRLRGLRSKLTRNSFFWGLTTTLTSCLGLLLLLLLLSTVVPIPRALALILLLCSGLAPLGWFCLRPLVLRPTLEKVALKVEHRFPNLKNLLISAIQLWGKRGAHREGYSRELIERVALEAANVSKRLDWEGMVDRRKLLRSSRTLAAALIVFLGWASISPSTLYPPLWGLLSAGQRFASTVLKVGPGDAVVLKGGELVIEAKTYGRSQRSLSLHVGDSQLPLRKVEENLFSRTVSGIEKGFTYWVEGRGVRSEEYEVEVVELPAVIGLNLKYLYPSYTGLPPLMVKGRGDVTALVGTVVELRGESTKELTSAHLVFDDTMRVRGWVEGRKFGADFTVKGDGTYHIDIGDSLGNRNEDPIEYQISSIYDEGPTAEIEEPGRDIDLPKSMVVALSIHATDDFGLTQVLLGYSKAGEERKSLIADLRGDRTEVTLDYSWDLSSLGLLPGDVLRYWVEVWDNDTYGGPKRGVSTSYTIRFPTLEEIYREVARGEEEIAEEIGAILPQQEELSEKLEQLSLELKKTKELGWEERRAAAELVAKQKEIAEKIRDVLGTLEETLESMNNAIVIDQETLDKLAELRRLWEEVETEEMRDAMERLREALNALKPEDIEKAMRELSLSQEELKRRLERTLEVLKRLQQEQRLKALVEKAEELLREQKEIREETEKAGEEELDKLSQREEKLREESESLKEELEDLAEELRSSDPEVSQSLESLSKAMEGKRLSQKMSEVSSCLARGDGKRTIPKQEDIAQQLSELSAGLSSTLSQLLASRKSEVEKAIVKAAGDLLYLSREEEELSKAVSEGRESPSLDPGKLARTEQSLMEGVRKIAEELYKASRKSFFITPDVGRALSSSMSAMEEAQGALEKGNLLAAERATENAVQRLNLAIEELFKSQGQLCACGSAGGLEEALSKMAGLSGEQMGVNEAVQGLLPLDLQGGKLSMEARAQMARLAARQSSIAEKLKSIAEGIGERSDLLGDLDRLAEEMGEVAEKLESGQVDRKLVERQQRILSRLLDAQRSLHQRDYSQRRRAEVGEDFPGLESPPELPEELLEKDTREDLLKALREKYPKEYERLIRAYFKALLEPY